MLTTCITRLKEFVKITAFTFTALRVIYQEHMEKVKPITKPNNIIQPSLEQLKFLQQYAGLNSSHTLAYNPNARRAYEKSQHAEDFGRIKINLYL